MMSATNLANRGRSEELALMALNSHLANPTELAAEHRVEILARLHEWLAEDELVSEQLLSTVMAAAECWCDWPLIVHLLEMASHTRALHTADAMRLAYAYWQAGDAVLALDTLRPVVLREPASTAPWQLHQAILRWHEFCQAFPFYGRTSLAHEDLALHLLGHHHQESFAAVYHDEDIGHLCGLPHFSSPEHWHQWLDRSYALGDELTFGIFHRHWGLVGSVCLIVHQNLALFYYWVGKEFRGQGFGPMATNLALQMAMDVYGVNTCYAKVLQHNAPSRRGLQKLGFTQLDFSALAPHEENIFYRLGPAAPREVIAEQLRELLQRIGCSTSLALPLSRAT